MFGQGASAARKLEPGSLPSGCQIRIGKCSPPPFVYHIRDMPPPRDALHTSARPRLRVDDRGAQRVGGQAFMCSDGDEDVHAVHDVDLGAHRHALRAPPRQTAFSPKRSLSQSAACPLFCRCWRSAHAQSARWCHAMQHVARHGSILEHRVCIRCQEVAHHGSATATACFDSGHAPPAAAHLQHGVEAQGDGHQRRRQEGHLRVRARLASRQPLASRPAAGEQTCSRGVMRGSTPSPTHRPSMRLEPGPQCRATLPPSGRRAKPTPHQASGGAAASVTRHATQRHPALHVAGEYGRAARLRARVLRLGRPGQQAGGRGGAPQRALAVAAGSRVLRSRRPRVTALTS